MGKKKVVRNKARDAIGDYYKTNRKLDQDSREYQEKQKEQGKQPYTKREKIMVAVAVVLLIAVAIKYFVL